MTSKLFFIISQAWLTATATSARRAWPCSSTPTSATASARASASPPSTSPPRRGLSSGGRSRSRARSRPSQARRSSRDRRWVEIYYNKTRGVRCIKSSPFPEMGQKCAFADFLKPKWKKIHVKSLTLRNRQCPPIAFVRSLHFIFPR